MVRRWIIRGFLIGMVTAMAVLWVASYWRWGLIKVPAGRGNVWVWCISGSLVVADDNAGAADPWVWMLVPPDDRAKDSFKITYQLTRFHGAGFAMGTAPLVVYVPLWFPVVVGLLASLIVWRKKGSLRTGFPVGPAAHVP